MSPFYKELRFRPKFAQEPVCMPEALPTLLTHVSHRPRSVLQGVVHGKGTVEVLFVCCLLHVLVSILAESTARAAAGPLHAHWQPLTGPCGPSLMASWLRLYNAAAFAANSAGWQTGCCTTTCMEGPSWWTPGCRPCMGELCM